MRRKICEYLYNVGASCGDGGLITNACVLSKWHYTHLQKRRRCFWMTKTLCKISTREMCPHLHSCCELLYLSHFYTVFLLLTRLSHYWLRMPNINWIFFIKFGPVFTKTSTVKRMVHVDISSCLKQVVLEKTVWLSDPVSQLRWWFNHRANEVLVFLPPSPMAT